MHRINDIVVQQGKIVIAQLPFADGQRVDVTVNESAADQPRMSIQEVRKLLQGTVLQFDHPFEPFIPEQDWELNK